MNAVLIFLNTTITPLQQCNPWQLCCNMLYNGV